jgi:aspartyl-tRNA(Asn)/glutamyl-tRNA(Gln) amidotransferase subunit C
MKVDKELIKKVASVARLKLSEEECEGFSYELKDVLENFSNIDKCDTKGLEPSFHPVKLKDHLRADKVEKCLSQEKALENSSLKKDGYFKGPKSV